MRRAFERRYESEIEEYVFRGEGSGPLDDGAIDYMVVGLLSDSLFVTDLDDVVWRNRKEPTECLKRVVVEPT